MRPKLAARSAVAVIRRTVEGGSINGATDMKKMARRTEDTELRNDTVEVARLRRNEMKVDIAIVRARASIRVPGAVIGTPIGSHDLGPYHHENAVDITDVLSKILSRVPRDTSQSERMILIH